MSDTYRLSGSCLGINDCWVDATVTGVTISGDIHLEEDTTSSRTWVMDYDEFHDGRDRNRIVNREQLADPEHHIWATLLTAWDEVAEPPHEEVTDSLRSNIHTMFTTLLYEQQQ